MRRLASLDAVALRALEALSPRTVTQIELDVALTGSSVWRKIEDLSRGQKATAVLLLLLLPTEAPLIVDQPEDDLDNRFIVESVVPALRATKADRQYLFATHNANVPVLADAELIAGLTAETPPAPAAMPSSVPRTAGLSIGSPFETWSSDNSKAAAMHSTSVAAATVANHSTVIALSPAPAVRRNRSHRGNGDGGRSGRNSFARIGVNTVLAYARAAHRLPGSRAEPRRSPASRFARRVMVKKRPLVLSRACDSG